jgi:hypothetical protein
VGDLTMYRFKVYERSAPLGQLISNPNIQDIIAPGIGELLVILKFKKFYFYAISVRCVGPSWRSIPFRMINFEEMVVCYPDADARGSAWRDELLRLNAQVFDNPLSIN